MAKARSHLIAIRASFDSPVTAKAARHAVYNHIHGLALYGDGKPSKLEAELMLWPEPYGTGKITVRR